MMNKFFILTLPLSAVLLNGCLATSDEVGVMQNQLNAINSSVRQIQEEQTALTKKLDSMDTTISRDLADKDELQSSISQLSARVDDLVSVLGAQLEETKSFRKELLPSQIYNTAYGQYLKKQYTSSVQSFETYIEKFPYGEHVEKALYFKGNGYSELGKYSDAAFAYATLMSQFPESNYTAAARIRYAQALLGIDPSKNKSEAITYYKSVVQDFPGSREADTAKNKLNELDPKPAAKPAQTAKPKTQAEAVAAKPAATKPQTETKPAAKPAAAKQQEPAKTQAESSK